MRMRLLMLPLADVKPQSTWNILSYDRQVRPLLSAGAFFFSALFLMPTTTTSNQKLCATPLVEANRSCPTFLPSAPRAGTGRPRARVPFRPPEAPRLLGHRASILRPEPHQHHRQRLVLRCGAAVARGDGGAELHLVCRKKHAD